MGPLARSLTVVSLLALPLGGCASIDFDPVDWLSGDWFGSKKPLPGARKPVFPEGVPGVAKGVPPELYKGRQQAAGVATEPPALAPVEPSRGLAAAPTGGAGAPREIRPVREAAVQAEPPKSKRKARAKPKAKPKRKAVAKTTAAPAGSQSASTPAQSPWPDPPRQQQPKQQQVQWPDPPQSRPPQQQVQWPDPPPPR